MAARERERVGAEDQRSVAGDQSEVADLLLLPQG